MTQCTVHMLSRMPGMKTNHMIFEDVMYPSSWKTASHQRYISGAFEAGLSRSGSDCQMKLLRILYIMQERKGKSAKG